MIVVVYDPPTPAAAPIAFWIFLLCIASRAVIMTVRRMLSAKEIEKYGAPKRIVVATPAEIEFDCKPSG